MYTNFYKKNFNQLNFLRFVFYIFPVTMLTSSGYITFYFSFLSFFSILFFLRNNIKIRIFLIDYCVLTFFLLSILSSLININENGIIIFIKSILDVRFFLFFLIFRNIIKYELVNIKILFLLCLISSVFLILNIFSQHIFGFDIFGHPPFAGRFNGSFESEAIAGSYIQKLSILSILSVILLDITEGRKKLIILLIINILGIGILLTFDRMPFLIYLFGILISIILIKNFRLNLLISFLIFILLTSILFKNYEILYERYSILKIQIPLEKIANLIQKVKNDKFSYSSSLSENSSKKESNDILISGDYIKLYYSAYHVWLSKPLLGSGVKSFGRECLKLVNNKNINIKYISCNTHPHNIYLEILVNIGVIGMLIFFFIIILILKDILNNIDLKKYNNNKSILSTFFLVMLINELIPIRSYGSIFQTVNGSMFWFIVSLMSSIKWVKLDKITFS
jgi:hypothetical protein